MGDAVEFDLQRDGDLLLHFLGGMAGPLGDDLGVGVGDVWVGLDGQIVEGDDAPNEKHQRSAENQQAVAQGKIDQAADHSFCSATAVENCRASATTCSPLFTPPCRICMSSEVTPADCTCTL